MKSKKQQLRDKADKLWKQVIIGNKTLCEVCENEPINTAHHFYTRSNFGHLRYNINNGIAIGKECHFAHHHKGDPSIHARIIKKRGFKWYEDLRDISREKPASYQSIKYYLETIEQLNNIEQ